MGDAILLRIYKRGMLCFSEHTNGGCYVSQNIQTGDAIFLRTKQTGDAMLLRTKQTGDAILLRTYSSKVIILVNCLSHYPYLCLLFHSSS